MGLCDWRVRRAALHKLRRRFCSVTTRKFCSATTTTAGNAGRNLHDHSDCYQLQFKRTAGKYAGHVDRQVMSGWRIDWSGRGDLQESKHSEPDDFIFPIA